MKIRNGHVSNSSSSSFAFAIYNHSGEEKSVEFLAEEFFESEFAKDFIEVIDEYEWDEEEINYKEKFIIDFPEDVCMDKIEKGLSTSFNYGTGDKSLVALYLTEKVSKIKTKNFEIAVDLD
jgi:hypothetical protein